MIRPKRLFHDRGHRDEPVYMGQVLALADRQQLRRPGVHQVLVEHDAGCKRPDGGKCTCKPDVRLAPRPGEN